MDKSFQELLDKLEQSRKVVSYLNDSSLIVDGMNTFIRCFCMVNDINNRGEPVGGLTGFLKSIAFTIRKINPTRVIIVFDGSGSTTNKRNLYPDYKNNRHIKRITRWDTYSSQQEESQAIINQLSRLIQYLQCIPVSLISIDKIEADDVIGYLSDKFNKVTIVSSDQDFMQLVSPNVTVYSPIKKKFYMPQNVKDEYEIWPQNFLTTKILLGDKGDNVPKLMGFGKKKMFQHFPQLLQEEKVTLQEILRHSIEHIGKLPFYSKILDITNQLEINKQLMNLSQPVIPQDDLDFINNLIKTKPPELNKSQFYKMYNEDLLEDKLPGMSWLSESFSYLNSYKLKEE